MGCLRALKWVRRGRSEKILAVPASSAAVRFQGTMDRIPVRGEYRSRFSMDAMVASPVRVRPRPARPPAGGRLIPTVS